MWETLVGGLWRSTLISITASSALPSSPWGRPPGKKTTDSRTDLFGALILPAERDIIQDIPALCGYSFRSFNSRYQTSLQVKCHKPSASKAGMIENYLSLTKTPPRPTIKKVFVLKNCSGIYIVRGITIWNNLCHQVVFAFNMEVFTPSLISL